MVEITPFPDGEREFYIIFSDDGDSPKWVQPFLQDGFRHCFILAQSGPYVTQLEPNPDSVNISVIYGEDIKSDNSISVQSVVNSYLSLPLYSALRVNQTVDKNKSLRHISNLIQTCVTILKVTLGTNTWAYTPYQFYKYLLKNGAEVILHRET